MRLLLRTLVRSRRSRRFHRFRTRRFHRRRQVGDGRTGEQTGAGTERSHAHSDVVRNGRLRDLVRAHGRRELLFFVLLGRVDLEHQLLEFEVLLHQ